MNDKPQLGVIRVSAAGAVFDIPYFEEDAFTRMTFAVRATYAFDFHGVFIPYRALDYMMKIPNNETAGMTRQ